MTQKTAAELQELTEQLVEDVLQMIENTAAECYGDDQQLTRDNVRMAAITGVLLRNLLAQDDTTLRFALWGKITTNVGSILMNIERAKAQERAAMLNSVDPNTAPRN